MSMSTKNTKPSTEAPAGKETIEEIQWTDDSIRWEGGLHVEKAAKESDKESDDEEDYMFDPFADPDPFELFSFQFERPDDNNLSECCDGDGEKKKDKKKLIDIQIRGYKTDAEQVWQSTGLTLWRASDYLCQYQMENLNLFQNKRILELGAGLGLNGILAWRSTATTASSSSSSSEVCITDGDIDALVHLRENVERNRSTTVGSDDGDDDDDVVGKVSCHQLIWGKESSDHFLSHVANDKKYDVIIASDIVYAPVIVEPLWETVETLLKKPNGCDEEEGGVFVMAYAKRKVPVSIELVCEAAVAHGFVYELVKENDEKDIWVYTFRFSG